MAAKRITPQQERAIVLIAGESGCGKSFWVANLTNALIFDTDIGGGLSYAAKRIERNGSELIQVGSYPDVIGELTSRRGKLNAFTTIAVDHLSTLQQDAVLRWNPDFEENTFGREHDRANKEWRKLRDLARFGDFNLICTAHMKDRYEGKKCVGVKTDASKNIEADFHTVLYLKKTGFPCTANVHKWRRDPEDERGAVPATFKFTMEEFCRIHGTPLNTPRQEIAMATAEDCATLLTLLKDIKLPEGTSPENWLKKAKADSWEETTQETIQKCIDYCRKLGSISSPAA